jgi:hypothetical protein
VSRVEECRTEAAFATRSADEARFAEVRLRYQQAATMWLRLADHFDAMERRRALCHGSQAPRLVDFAWIEPGSDQSKTRDAYRES